MSASMPATEIAVRPFRFTPGAVVPESTAAAIVMAMWDTCPMSPTRGCCVIQAATSPGRNHPHAISHRTPVAHGQAAALPAGSFAPGSCTANTVGTSGAEFAVSVKQTTRESRCTVLGALRVAKIPVRTGCVLVEHKSPTPPLTISRLAITHVRVVDLVCAAAVGHCGTD